MHDPKRRDTQQQETYTTINHEQAPISDSEETGKRMRLNWKQWDGILVDGGRWFGFMGRTDGCGPFLCALRCNEG